MEEQHQIVKLTRPTADSPDRVPDRVQDIEVLDASVWPTHDEGAAQHDAPDPARHIEMSLLPETRRLVRDFPIAGLERPYLDHLERRLLRKPRDLASHVRRILMLRKLDDADGIAGALADLFLVLGNNGRRLRTRLLAMVEAQLEPGLLRFFSDHIDTSLTPTDAMPRIPCSRLSRHVAGTTDIVIRETGSDMPPAALARESVDHGQDDIALTLLEGALDADPGDTDVCDALLDLYERKALRRRFFRTYTVHLGRQLGHAERWDMLASKFRGAEP